jgi:hypothetical protein
VGWWAEQSELIALPMPGVGVSSLNRCVAAAFKRKAPVLFFSHDAAVSSEAGIKKPPENRAAVWRDRRQKN